MVILVFFVTWVLIGSGTSSLLFGFLFAVVAAIIYWQGSQIARLKTQIAEVNFDPIYKRLAHLEDAQKLESGGETSQVPVSPPFQESSRNIEEETPYIRLQEESLQVEEKPTMNEAISAPFPTPEPASMIEKHPDGMSHEVKIPRGQTTAEWLEQTFGKTLSGFILRGNPIARIGVVILFFGVIFALKLASDEGYLPIELRLATAAIGAIVLLVLGWKLREKNNQFAVTLQGAGAGVFYITSFVAFRLYHLIPGPLAFVLLLGVTVLSASLAVLENARSLAVLGMIGGFLAPALTSQGGGNHVALFSYLVVLNIGIFGMCWFKAWREVNLTGFIFTFILGSAWGAKYYQPELFSSTEAFLLFFIALYSSINILFAVRRIELESGPSGGTVDSLMTFGTALWAVILQGALVKQFEYGLAWSALGLGAFHVALAWIVFNRYGNKLRFLVESYFAIGLCLLTLSIPFAVSGRLTSAIWALEATALVWSGVRQRQTLMRWAGLALLVISSLIFFENPGIHQAGFSFLNPFFEGVVLLTLAHILCAKLLMNADKDVVTADERACVPSLCGAAILWWCAGGAVEIAVHLDKWDEWLKNSSALRIDDLSFALNCYSLFTSVTVALFWTISRKWALPLTSLVRLCIMPIHFVLLILFLTIAGGIPGYRGYLHPFVSYGFVSWSIAFLVHYVLLYLDERETSGSEAHYLHLLPLWLGSVVLSFEACWLVKTFLELGSSWSTSTYDFVPSAVMLLVSSAALRAKSWPFRIKSTVYLKGLWPFAVWLFVFTLLLNLSHDGDASPLPYIPLLNPLDLGQCIAILGVVGWWIRLKRAGEEVTLDKSTSYFMLGAWSFIWATSILLRCMHHYVGIRWDFDALFASNTVQTGLSIFWSILALVLMTCAHVKSWRTVWKAGAILIGIVVAKLFVIDLSGHGTLGRIVAFLGVGLLMMGIGYLAPIPPPKNIKVD